ncbi:MAG: hypothetical protein KatS3mg094_091 [Candidatus Parcubacteria bacterium]|nr:MAG: hypothetical protein KatS3mg094_091 [Candidatus Parcubacteria bacterium]
MNKQFDNIEKNPKAIDIHINSKDWFNKNFAFNHNHNLKTISVSLIIPSISRKTGVENSILQGVILNTLAGPQNSRLFKILRQENGLIYDVYSGSYLAGNNFGYVYIEFSSDLKNIREILNIIFNEIKILPEVEEIKLIKKYLINRNNLVMDDPRDYFLDNLYALFYFKKLFLDNYYEKIIEQIRREAIRNFIKTYWNLKKYKLIIQSNEKGVRFEDLRTSIFLGSPSFPFLFKFIDF